MQTTQREEAPHKISNSGQRVARRKKRRIIPRMARRMANK